MAGPGVTHDKRIWTSYGLARVWRQAQGMRILFEARFPLADECWRKALRASLRTPTEEEQMKEANRFPPGWDEGRVAGLLEHYESQTDEESVDEDRAAFEEPGHERPPLE